MMTAQELRAFTEVGFDSREILTADLFDKARDKMRDAAAAMEQQERLADQQASLIQQLMQQLNAAGVANGRYERIIDKLVAA